MTIYCQFGYARYMTEGQLIEIYHNESKLSMENGEYLTPVASRKTKMFYIKPVECQNGDLLMVNCKVGLRLLGEDEDRTFKALFTVDSNAPETEFKFSRVGFGSGFSLLKGNIQQVSLVTAKEKRLNSIKAKMENNNG